VLKQEAERKVPYVCAEIGPQRVNKSKLVGGWGQVGENGLKGAKKEGIVGYTGYRKKKSRWEK